MGNSGKEKIKPPEGVFGRFGGIERCYPCGPLPGHQFHLPAIDGSEDMVLVQEKEFNGYNVSADVEYADKLFA